MDDQARKNIELVENLMQQAGAKAGAAIQEGNKGLIPVPINYTADSGRKFEGTLFFRRPSAMDYIRMGAIKSQLLQFFGVRPIVDVVPDGQGGVVRVESMAHVDASVQYLARALAAFDVVLVNPPEWFKNYRESTDTDLLVHVYGEYDTALLSFRDGSQGGPNGGEKAGERQENVAGTEAVRVGEPEGRGRDSSADGPAAPGHNG